MAQSANHDYQQNHLIEIKLMYKGTPYVNKLIKKKQHERSMEYHLENIKNAKPMTRGQDYSYDLVQINNKKKQYHNELRFTEIERENRILLEKITSMVGKNKRATFNETTSSGRFNKSLNSGLRKRQLQNIEVENAKFLRRLQEKKSDYETDKFRQEWKKQKNVMKIMSNYPFVLTDRPKVKRTSIPLMNYRKNEQVQLEPVEIVKVRVINGVTFLISVRLTSKMLQIVGDSRDRKELKVIEIEREEGIEFIEEECQGKIQLIFDRLRYDTDEATLYLVGNEVTLEDLIEKKPDTEVDNEQEQNPNRRLAQENKQRRVMTNEAQEAEEPIKQEQLAEKIEQNDQANEVQPERKNQPQDNALDNLDNEQHNAASQPQAEKNESQPVPQK